MITRKSNLTICGGEHDVANLSQVKAVNTPLATYREKLNKDGSRSVSHQPISHIDMINRFRSELSSRHFQVQSECHNLAKDGARYFGLFQVSHGSRKGQEERATIIGLRNAHDKAFAAGMCAGDAPFVCDNLIFSNEVVVARKHMGELDKLLDVISQKISSGLGQLFTMWNTQDNRVKSYQEKEITNSEANDLIVKAYQAKAINLQRIPDVLNQWESSDHPSFWDRNVNSLYNAFTEVYKGNLQLSSQPAHLMNRSYALHSVLDPFVGIEKEKVGSELVLA
jgi:hypothetical protein|tara:strand:+ start:1003 stop:1845 length:843 start_codon:yes stop_codon:yes gene_type:complete